MSDKVGIMAYGSLIDDPGTEIKNATTDIIRDIMTPFKIEYARKSKGRGYAPTLVPHETGTEVSGQIFVVELSIDEAANSLWRREIGQVGSGRQYRRPSNPGENSVLVETENGFAGLDTVLYTKIAANINPLTANHLAQLAINSVGRTDPERDGITYLIRALNNGISTPLSESYKSEILYHTQCDSLEEALAKLS